MIALISEDVFSSYGFLVKYSVVSVSNDAIPQHHLIHRLLQHVHVNIDRFFTPTALRF